MERRGTFETVQGTGIDYDGPCAAVQQMSGQAYGIAAVVPASHEKQDMFP
jgi:hypothetical protein